MKKSVWKHVCGILLMLVLVLSLPVCASAKTVRKTVKAKKNSDITSALQKELNKAKAGKNTYEITVKPGTYKINGTLKIYSNTTLKMEGVTFKRKKKDVVMLRYGGNVTYKENYKGYSQAKNVKLVGGTWDGSGKTGDLMRFGHGKNLTFENVTLTNVKDAHHIEIAACRDVTFRDCTFSDFVGKRKSNHIEALQIDIMRKEHFDYYPSYDETPCKNVTITGCTFRNLQSGVGTHSAVTGSYHRDIHIDGNTFDGMHGYAVIAMGYADSTINNNVMTNCGFGIEFRTLSNTLSSVYKAKKKNSGVTTNLNCEISGNKINIVQTGYKYRISGIKVYGKNLKSASKGVPAGNYRVSGLRITNNEIVQNCKGVVMILEGMDNSTVQGNTVTCDFVNAGHNMGGDGGSGIRLDNSKGNTVSGNTVRNNEAAANGRRVCGICLYKSSDNNTVTGNVVTGATSRSVYNKGTGNNVTGNIVD